MDIALYHNHYDARHLGMVKAQMLALGAPAIRAIYNPVHGMWMAVEGCHRLRAAAELGLTPEIIDISNDTTVTVQADGDDVVVSVADLAQELVDNAHRATVLTF